MVDRWWDDFPGLQAQRSPDFRGSHWSFGKLDLSEGPSCRRLGEVLGSWIAPLRYIFGNVNILTRNRRVAIVFEIADKSGGAAYVAMVIVGGITVDSIRPACLSRALCVHPVHPF